MFFCETQGQGTHGLRSASSDAGCQGDCARERRPAPSELCSLLRRAAAAGGASSFAARAFTRFDARPAVIDR